MDVKNITMGYEALPGMPIAFVDTYVHGLDAKKRLTIPSDWRSMVGQPEQVFVMPSSIEKCLCVYPARSMTKMFQQLQEMSETDAEAQRKLRDLSSNSNISSWDAQGRIRIKDSLLDYAGLKSEVVLVGVFKRFELWSPEIWKLNNSDISQSKILDATRSAGL